MRAKILKVISSNHTIYHNQYGDDYSDITKHVVSGHSDWEEVTPEEFSNLESRIRTVVNKKREPHHYLLITDSGQSVRQSINEMVKEKEAKIRKLEQERKNRERKNQEIQNKRKQNAALKLQQKLEKMTGAKVKLEKI
jgi:predicted nuclease with TOPRIM domain